MKLLNHKWIRILLLFLLTVVGLALGYMRWTYVILWDHGFMLAKRYTVANIHAYPSSWDSMMFSLQHDPRWLSLIIYSLAPIVLSLTAVYLTFLKKSYIINTLVVYGFLWTLIILLSVVSLVIPSYAVGIGLAQNIKNLAQMPFITLLLLAGFKVSQNK